MYSIPINFFMFLSYLIDKQQHKKYNSEGSYIASPQRGIFCVDIVFCGEVGL